MELWIRSQDKTDLLSSKKLKVYYNETTNNWIVVNREEINNGTPLGQYLTKERALEVLDEIQKVINQQEIHCTSDGVVTLPERCFVYQMPKE
jgi:hypothetical protein